MGNVPFSTFIDHFDTLSVEWDKATKAILGCGFVMDTGSNALPPLEPKASGGAKRSFRDLTKARFMFPNCPMISTYATSKEDGLYHCYGNYDPAHPGMYHQAFVPVIFSGSMTAWRKRTGRSATKRISKAVSVGRDSCVSTASRKVPWWRRA